jgi:DNA-binding CsgD family transcriptional regulator
MVATAIGLAQGGRLEDAEQLAQQMHDRALATDDPWLGPRGASALGWTAFTRGLPQTATRYLRIAVGSLYGFDTMFLRYNLSFLARAAALAGFIDEARSALDAPPDSPRLPLFQAEWEIAEAAVLAADGHLTRASSHALGAAHRAASLGQWAIVGVAAGDAARYTGAPDAARLVATAAAQVDDPLLGLVAVYARARASSDGPELSAVSAHLEDLGTILLAAEASYAAAQSHRAGRDNRRAAVAAERATALHGRCENAVIPWVAGFQAEQILTRRERHIALLAAAGRRDAEIAEDAQISIRTVQNHLAQAYRKLGVASRRDLPDALARPPIVRE